MNRTAVSSLRAALVLFGCLVLVGCEQRAAWEDLPTVAGSESSMRRLTESQYRQTIADVFGTDISIVGKFDPDIRQHGLQALGSSTASVTPSGIEQYQRMAASIAMQVVSEAHRERLLSCVPHSTTDADAACASQFLQSYGLRLWRRPLSDTELLAWVDTAGQAAIKLVDFYAGLELALAGMLMSPEFLFVIDRREPDAAALTGWRLDSYSLASRLSYLLWNSAPDEVLLRAAADRSLLEDAALHQQVSRLLASPRLANGIRAFFSDLYRFQTYNEINKDKLIYPAFTDQTMNDAREQTLRTIVSHVIEDDADFRDLYTTRKTQLTRNLGRIYKVPVRVADGWETMEFPETSQRAGILSHVSFMAQHSHAGRSSATLRGKFIREAILCQEIPAPPADVDFSLVRLDDGSVHKTARDRLKAHRTEPRCAGCHTLMDPLGLPLEVFDGVGVFRTTENGVTIDTAGELNGNTFAGAVGLGQALHDSDQATSCLVKRLYAYSRGSAPAGDEYKLLEALEQSFAANGYSVKRLLEFIVMNPSFRMVSAPEYVEASL